MNWEMEAEMQRNYRLSISSRIGKMQKHLPKIKTLKM